MATVDFHIPDCCPHCNKALNLDKAQAEKIQETLAGLAPGKAVKITCPACRRPIRISREEERNTTKTAFDLFPGLMEDALMQQERPAAEQPEPAPAAPEPTETRQRSTGPPPPKPPDISWLDRGDHEVKARQRNIPAALLLIADGDIRATVSQALQELGYLIETAASASEAMAKMRFADFSAIVLHPAYEGGALAESRFHRYMQWLPMEKRRCMYYILIGPRFHTLYDLEALSLSANLVINEQDRQHLSAILRKGFHDYERLFGPLLTTLKEHGKQSL